MRHTIVQNGIRKCDPRAVDPCTTIWQYGENQISARHALDCDVAQARREDDIVGYDVVLKDSLEGSLVGGGEHRSYVFEGFVGGHEDGEVGDVEAGLVGSVEAKVDVQGGGLQCSVKSGVACTVGEELKGSAEGEYGIDFMNGDSLAELDVLVVLLVSSFFTWGI